MPHVQLFSPETLRYDLVSGIVVFLVALPLCLGVALASDAPLISGLVAGIIGGLLVGSLSGSHTSVSGPAAGLTAVVSGLIASLGSFEAFLLAGAIAGVIQIAMGVAKAGFISEFFPTSVIKGLLAAIGVILILKQVPHLLGHDTDPEGEMSFRQPDRETTFSEFAEVFEAFDPAAAAIGVVSLLLLVTWERVKRLKALLIPAPLVIVLLGVGLQLLFARWGGAWLIEPDHLVQVPVAQSISEFFGFVRYPDFTQLVNPAVYVAAVTIALVASLETLMNIEAVDRLDPQQRATPPNRELIAQGVGNLTAGLIGAIPVTSVIVRSSVNINAGGKTKLATIVHGALLLSCVMLIPTALNQIPLASLAAILIVTGFKLASPAVVRKMWSEGKNQFIPFLVTVLAIVLTDLLIGVLIGLGVAVAFILHSNLRRPLRRIVEKHVGGEVLRIELANQVSFLNRAVLSKTLNEVPPGGHVLLDARSTVYIDPDVIDLITDFKETTAPAKGIQVSLLGFREQYLLDDHIQYVDYTTRELQSKMTPQQVLQILKDGNERFRTGEQITRDLHRQLTATADGQFPLAVVLSCIDSRTPAEIIFDLGLGDIFSVRIAGNVISHKVLGSMEFGCAVAGAKLILVMGHTRCGAVRATVNLLCEHQTALEATGCENLDSVTGELMKSVDSTRLNNYKRMPDSEQMAFLDEVGRQNVLNTMAAIRQQSHILDRLVREGQIQIVGGLYDVVTGRIEFLHDPTLAH